MITTTNSLSQNHVQALRKGDADAFADLVEELSEPLARLAKRYLKNDEDVADALQDAFLSAYRALSRFSGNCEIRTWMYRIVVNTCLMKLRSRSRQQTASINDRIDDAEYSNSMFDAMLIDHDCPVSNVLDREAEQQLHRCIAQLPADHRRIIQLRDLQGFDTDETAEIMNLKPGAVKTRLHRARKALRELLLPYIDADVERN